MSRERMQEMGPDCPHLEALKLHQPWTSLCPCEHGTPALLRPQSSSFQLKKTQTRQMKNGEKN
jgi:hypothetical protein